MTLLNPPLNYFGGKGYDLHIILVAEFSCDRPEDTRASGLFLAVDNDRRVVVETDMRSVGTIDTLMSTNDYRLYDVAFFDGAAGGSALDGGDDNVADVAASTERTA